MSDHQNYSEVITPAVLKKRLDADEKLILIDVRTEDEFNFCKISGSINISLRRLMQESEKIDNNYPIILICHHGVRSMQALHLLKSQGFENVSSLQGGVEKWAHDIEPTMPRY